MNHKTLIDGVIKKELTRHKDERGFFEELIRVNDDFFEEGFAQLSHSFMHPRTIKAWHTHKTQVDWWFVSRGTLKVALFDLRTASKTYRRLNEFIIGETGENVILKIPPGVAHGCKVLSCGAELFYITSKIYDHQEEGRIAYDDAKISYNWLSDAPIK